MDVFNRNFKQFLIESSIFKNFDGKKVIVAYKLFNMINGKLYPLYVNAKKEIPLHKWIDAEIGPVISDGKNKGKIKTNGKLGGSVALRPGWHAGDHPVATHIGEPAKPKGKPAYRRDSEVWAEVYITAEIDYQDQANKNGTNKQGKIIKKNADLDYIPKNGYYRYKTNSNMLGDWIIGGSMYVNRILTDDEVEKINKLDSEKDGIVYKDLPRRPR